MTRHSAGILLFSAFWCPGALAQPAPQEPPSSRKVAIVVYDGAALIDFAGPHDVLNHAGEMRRVEGRPAFEVFTVAPRAGSVTLSGGLRIMPDHTLREAPAADIVVIPGGAHDPLLYDRETMAGLDKLLRNADIRMAVCNAPAILGALHYLDGIRVTSSVNRGLRHRFPKAQVVDDVRVVDAGSVITTGTGASGMDGALVIVARFLGRDMAMKVAEHLAYSWRPGQ
jgi:transcriptional regulator GlxA family with amidase domain